MKFEFQTCRRVLLLGVNTVGVFFLQLCFSDSLLWFIPELEETSLRCDGKYCLKPLKETKGENQQQSHGRNMSAPAQLHD